jgi:DNA-binding NarL/FixJ family response regulator
MSIKILIADDYKIIRESLRKMIERLENMEVIGEAEDGRSVVSMAKELIPDIIIMDIVMPGLNGIIATRQINSALPHIKILALSMHNERQLVLEMFKAGASGYLLKDSASEELAQSIKTVCSNRIYLSPAIGDENIRDYVRNLNWNSSTNYQD